MRRLSQLVIFALVVAVPVVLVGCSETVNDPQSSKIEAPTFQYNLETNDAKVLYQEFETMLADMNLGLSGGGSDMRVGQIEWITLDGGEHAGNTVFFNNVGNKRLGSHWVPNDPRRFGGGAGDEITYLVDGSDASVDVPAAASEAAIDAGMNTWNTQSCSDGLKIVKNADPGFDPDIVDGLLGFGGFGTTVAQITHAGWTNVFGGNLLGVTFTLIWVDGGTGIPTDIDNNKRADVALREIFYNDNFTWDTTGGHIDIETVALHEAGHGLSQGHFGKLFMTPANGQFHFAPLAVMNAGYTQVQRSLAGTDEAGHCANWGSWPNN